MSALKKVLAVLLILGICTGTAGKLEPEKAQAAAKPKVPQITLSLTADGKGITVEIAPTENATGYGIYMKKPGTTKFKKVTVLKNGGKSEQEYTINDLKDGIYAIRVRAFRKYEGKTIWGSYCNVERITIGDIKEEEAGPAYSPEEYAQKHFPWLQRLLDSGKIELTTEYKKDTIMLGSWDLENSKEDNKIRQYYTDGVKEELEWMVLDYSEDGKKALVLSKYVICHREFHNQNTKVNWEFSELRRWLNEDFYQEAFSETERSLIQTVTLENDDNPKYYKGDINATQDRIFPLSVTEFNKYVAQEPLKDYMDCKGICIDGNKCAWMLRTLGNSGLFTVAAVDGQKVDTEGFLNLESLGVRPAFWIELTPDIIKSNNLSVDRTNKPEVTNIYVKLGSFDLEDSKGYTDGRKEDLEWEIIDYDENYDKALLISRYVIAYKAYNEVEDDKQPVTWEQCTLRSWLNDDFYKAAFTKSERSLIKQVSLANERYFLCDGGNDTEDRIFLLSSSEFSRYYPAGDEFHAPKKSCAALFVNGVYSSYWWLRSPGYYQYYAAQASNEKGNYANHGGYKMTENGEIYVLYGGAVRPAFWLKLKP